MTVTDDNRVDSADDITMPDAAEDSHPREHAPQYGVGPFSVREVALIGVWVVAFVVSFFSISVVRFDSVWTSGISWILTIGVPTVAVFLIALRRLSPQGIRRVGSLGIDQFASVAFSVSSVVWLQLVWETVAFAVETGQWLRTWVIWVSLVLMVIGVFLTVFAPFIAPFDEDFAGRDEVPAHRNARPIRPVTARPAAERPVTAPAAENTPEPEDATSVYPIADGGFGDPSTRSESETAQPDPAEDDARVAERADGTVDEDVFVEDEIAAANESPAAEEVVAEPAADEPAADEPVSAPRTQAFWALAPEERDVVDELGLPMFRIGPTAWALVIEDRGSTFVVRHEDGRTGYLNDVSGVTRG